ncbi:MAG: proline dehydrogenase family protein [Crocinitomicaceae bacterium]
MISFDNTEVAFESKTDADLKRAYRLFKMVSNPKMVKFGKWATNLALSIRFPIRGMVKKTIFKQFCGGETKAECEQTINSLWNYKIGTILDYSVEGKESSEDLEKTKEEIISTIVKAAESDSIPFSVFKVTGVATFSILEKLNDPSNQLSENDKMEFKEVTRRVEEICKSAHDHKVPLFIDAEDFCIQNSIDRLVTSMMAKYNREQAIVYNTVQMYRVDRLNHLKNAVQNAKESGYKYAVKLVRGAYMEEERQLAKEKGYPDPIHPTKQACDDAYNAALEFLVDHLDYLSFCAGTHNEKSSLYLAELLDKNGIDRSDKRVYFAQLLGMSDHISFNLSKNNCNVAKYVPYGPVKEVLPYLIRRAEENTSIAGQTSRELSLIIKEKKRRKLA